MDGGLVKGKKCLLVIKWKIVVKVREGEFEIFLVKRWCVDIWKLVLEKLLLLILKFGKYDW